MSEIRLSQARETLADAELLVRGGGSLRSIINRAYYAAFYATLALLELEGLVSRKHSGVIALFDRNFVMTKRASKDASRALHDLFAWRQDMDYLVIQKPSDSDIEAVLRDSRMVVETVEAILRNE